MLDRQQLDTFATVLECQNFRKAASILHISPGAVTARVKSLEASVSATLLLREQIIMAAHAGEVILRHIMAVRLLKEDVFRVIKPGKFPPRNIAVAVNTDSLATWFEPIS
jgi:LysR family transcriptional regulator, chromosome initiation inhibitor